MFEKRILYNFGKVMQGMFDRCGSYILNSGLYFVVQFLLFCFFLFCFALHFFFIWPASQQQQPLCCVFSYNSCGLSYHTVFEQWKL
jgi:hypothetical protein